MLVPARVGAGRKRDKEALDQPEAVALSATFLAANPDPNATPATATFTLSLLDNRAPEPLDIQIGNTIEGDRTPLKDANGNLQHDQWGNIIPTGPEPGRQDTINDTPNNDRINAGAGDDVVNLFRGGQDEVDGGAGNDWIFTPRYSFYDRVHLMGGAGDDALGGGVSDDVLEGGVGRDSLHGGKGNDQQFGDAKDNPDALIAAGANALQGGAGDDYLEGGGGNDVLGGGAGHDVLMGGEGHDIIAGAATLEAASRDWSVMRDNGVITFDNFWGDWADSDSSGDIAYGGKGNDFIVGGRDDDIAQLLPLAA